MRPIKIRHDRICLKPFSIDLIQGFRDRYWLAALLLFGAGFALHVLQRRKLKFKSIPLSGQPDGLKDRIRKLLSDEGWRIEYDNQRYLHPLSGLRLADLELEKQ